MLAGLTLAFPFQVRADDLTPATLGPANGAEQVCIDTPLAIQFDQEPRIGNSGTIRVYRADGTLVDTIDITPDHTSTRLIGGAQAGGVPYPFKYYSIIVDGNTATIYPHQSLEYGQFYYVTIDAGVFTNAEGDAFSGIQGPDTWRFSTKTAAPPTGTAQLTVAADGSGDFCTVQGAIDFVPVNNAQRVVITVRPGTYREIVYVRSSKPLITVYGEDRDTTVIQYANNNNLNGAISGNFRANFGVDAADFTLANITLENTTLKGGSQAEAFRANNQRIFLNQVHLKSFQDTLLLTGTGFVTDSLIEGDVDFMWSLGGAAFFQQSELRALFPGYYTQIRNDSAHHGFVFVDCMLTRAPDLADNTMYLGRIDPRVFPDSQVVYINTAMDSHMRPVGWLLNNADCGQAPTLQFWEYHSTDLSGAPVDVSNRLACSRQLSDDEALQWSDPMFVLGGWTPSTSPPSFQSLTASPAKLWPPNHKMVPVTLTADVTDKVDPSPTVRIISVASNENSYGADWEITGDLRLNLRAERAGGGSGRVYTITVESYDYLGNRSTADVNVVVAHDE